MNKGIVIRSTGSWYTVSSVIEGEQEQVMCKIKGKFRMAGIRTTNPVAVGDFVEFIYSEKDDIGLIRKIEPRRNYIIRKSINLSKQAHIIAANIDLAILVVTLTKPKTSTVFVDRFLVSAEAYKIPALIVFNKTDIYTEKENSQLLKLTELYSAIGYDCIAVSAIEEINLSGLKDLMKGKVSVFSGNSGVGKSTLINAIEPGLDIKTAEISDVHKTGKHTTTFAEMHELSFGASIIDTPGIKGMGMVDMDNENLSIYFPEMLKEMNQCKFYNCTHTHEPNCAIKEAIEAGTISFSRYESYLSLISDSDEEKYR